jgi:hypothetical protein
VRRYILHLAALCASGLILAWSSSRGVEDQGFPRAEAEAPLFDSESVRNRDAKVDLTTTCIDVEATVGRWDQVDRESDAAANRKHLIQGLIVFTTVAFQAPVQSVGDGGASGPWGCSVNINPPNAAACSTRNAPGGGPAGSGACSTANNILTTATTCSVYQPQAPPVTPGSNNTSCSAVFTSGAYCSAGVTVSGGATTQSCSTSGGQNNGNTDGAAVCSAGGTAGSNKCSTNSVGTNTTCSTYQGQHQSCSAGATNAGNTATCSSFGGGVCSVSQPGPATGSGNQCTAIQTGSNVNGPVYCSTNNAGGGACSITVAMANTQNAQCTSFGTPAEGVTFKCSAIAAGTTACSVITSTGTLLGGPGQPVSGTNPPLTSPAGQCGLSYTPHPGA